MRNLALIFIGFFSLVVLGCSGEQESADVAVANGDSVTAVVQDTAVEQTSALQSEEKAPVVGEKSQPVPSDSVDLTKVDLGFDLSLQTVEDVLAYEAKRGSVRIPDSAIVSYHSGGHLFFCEEFNDFTFRTIDYKILADTLVSYSVAWSSNVQRSTFRVEELSLYGHFELPYSSNYELYKMHYKVVCHSINSMGDFISLPSYNNIELDSVTEKEILKNRSLDGQYWMTKTETESLEIGFSSYNMGQLSIYFEYIKL